MIALLAAFTVILGLSTLTLLLLIQRPPRQAAGMRAARERYYATLYAYRRGTATEAEAQEAWQAWRRACEGR